MYPEAEMVAMMKWARKARIFSVIRAKYTCHRRHTHLHFGGIDERIRAGGLALTGPESQETE